MAKKSPQGERTTNNKKIANAVRPGSKVSDIMKEADVDYADVQYAQTDGVIRGDGTTAPVFTITDEGKGLIDNDD